MLPALDPIQLRVLGSLIEKEIATPENYPLSLNSLIGACNQRSSRDPVLDLTEDQVRQALHSLEDLHIVTPVRDARVPKYEHRLRTVLNLRRDEIALLCLLILRGPQTPGELRSRADRLYTFDGIDTVLATLDRLAARPSATENSTSPTPDDPTSTGPLTVLLPRQPGARENRYAHLLGGPPAPSLMAEPTPTRAAPTPDHDLRLAAFDLHLAALEARLTQLTDIVHTLQSRIDQLHPAPSPSLEMTEDPL
jgi:uncharacterized protein